jgi:NTE family protein
MRAIAFVQALIEQGSIGGEFGRRLKNMLIHSINDDEAITPLGAVSKFNIEPDFLDHLFKVGRESATRWLASTFDLVGVRSSIDIRARFL